MTDLVESGQRFHDEAEEETEEHIIPEEEHIKPEEEHIIPEEELNRRRKYLEDLKSFLAEQQEKISLTLEQLGWTPEHFIKPQNKVTCPYNSSHIIPETSLHQHLETCQWLSKGVPRYQLNDVLNEKERLKNTPISTIQLDECKLNGILWNKAVKSGQVYTGQRKLPITPEDDTIILTPDERLAVHDYIVSEAQSQGIMMNVEKDEHLTIDWQKVIKKGVLESETSDKLTPLEKMEALRDFKRRRQKYRAKNVHITRKSYTEIIREVISNQVEMWGAEGDGEENKGDVEVVVDTETGQDSEYVNRESRGSQDSSGYSRDTGRGWSDRDRTDRGRDRESDRRRSYRDDRDRGSYRGQSGESSYRDQSRESRETYRDSNRDKSRESYRTKGHERRDYDRDYSRERNRKREREGSRERSRDRSRSSERRPPKREKYEVSQIKSERETTPMLDYEREESSSKTSHRDRYQEDSSSRSHKKSKKHKHKKKHKKHKDRRKSSSSSDSESPRESK